jgi:hypothetical protein
MMPTQTLYPAYGASDSARLLLTANLPVYLSSKGVDLIRPNEIQERVSAIKTRLNTAEKVKVCSEKE